jgi:N-acetylmuramoyl-L-alanine amidase
MTIHDSILPINPYSRPGTKRIDTLALCVHWTGVPNQRIEDVTSYYKNRAAGRDGYGSAHYGIDLDGAIYQWIPEDEVAYAVGSSALDPVSGKVYTDLARSIFGDYASQSSSPNWVSISVELTSVDDEGRFTDDTYSSAVDMFADLASRYNLDPMTRILRHYDVVGWKDCPRYFVNNPSLFLAFKEDVAKRMENTGGA